MRNTFVMVSLGCSSTTALFIEAKTRFLRLEE
jgi:hypothetical protein